MLQNALCVIRNVRPVITKSKLCLWPNHNGFTQCSMFITVNTYSKTLSLHSLHHGNGSNCLLLIKSLLEWADKSSRQHRDRWTAWREENVNKVGGEGEGGQCLLSRCVWVTGSSSVFSRSVSPLICVIIHFFVYVVMLSHCVPIRVTELQWMQYTSSSILHSKIWAETMMFCSLEHLQI